jgi:hypothetical protein
MLFRICEDLNTAKKYNLSASPTVFQYDWILLLAGIITLTADRKIELRYDMNAV